MKELDRFEKGNGKAYQMIVFIGMSLRHFAALDFNFLNFLHTLWIHGKLVYSFKFLFIFVSLTVPTKIFSLLESNTNKECICQYFCKAFRFVIFCIFFFFLFLYLFCSFFYWTKKSALPIVFWYLRHMAIWKKSEISYVCKILYRYFC